MKKEFIILAAVVLIALFLTFGCSIRIHCTKGVTEKEGDNKTKDKCMLKCAVNSVSDISRAIIRCEGQPRSCILNSAEWKERDKCYAKCK